MIRVILKSPARTLLAIGLLLSVAVSFAGIGRAANLMPHKATYDVRSVAVNSDSPVLNIRGTMHYSIENICDAWLAERQTQLELSMSMEQLRRVETIYNAYESHDGTSYEFFFAQDINGVRIETRDGRAERANRDAVATAYAQSEGGDPAPAEVQLPSRVEFPVENILKLLEDIGQGRKTTYIDLYDGIEADGQWQISTLVQPQKRPSSIKSKFPESALVSEFVWPVTSGYFRPDAEQPDFEISYGLHETSLSENVRIKYDSFTLEMSLTDLKPLPETC